MRFVVDIPEFTELPGLSELAIREQITDVLTDRFNTPVKVMVDDRPEPKDLLARVARIRSNRDCTVVEFTNGVQVCSHGMDNQANYELRIAPNLREQ